MKKKLKRQLDMFFKEVRTPAGTSRPVNTWTVAHVEDYLQKSMDELPEDAQRLINRKCVRYLIQHALDNDKSASLKVLEYYHPSSKRDDDPENGKPLEVIFKRI